MPASRLMGCLRDPAAVDVDVGPPARAARIGAELQPQQRHAAGGRRNQDLAEEDLAEILDDDRVMVDLRVGRRLLFPLEFLHQSRVDGFARWNAPPARRWWRVSLEMRGEEQM